jgi:hypothetical protein
MHPETRTPEQILASPTIMAMIEARSASITKGTTGWRLEAGVANLNHPACPNPTGTFTVDLVRELDSGVESTINLLTVNVPLDGTRRVDIPVHPIGDDEIVEWITNMPADITFDRMLAAYHQFFGVRPPGHIGALIRTIRR